MAASNQLKSRHRTNHLTNFLLSTSILARNPIDSEIFEADAVVKSASIKKIKTAKAHATRKLISVAISSPILSPATIPVDNTEKQLLFDIGSTIDDPAKLLEVCYEIFSANSDHRSNTVVEPFRGYLNEGDEKEMRKILDMVDCDAIETISDLSGMKFAISFGPAQPHDGCETEIVIEDSTTILNPFELLETPESDVIKICNEFYGPKSQDQPESEDLNDLNTLQKLADANCVLKAMYRAVVKGRAVIKAKFSAPAINQECNDFYLPLTLNVPADQMEDLFNSRYKIK